MNCNIKENISIASTKTYVSACTMLIQWLLENKPDVIPTDYKEELKRHSMDEKSYIEHSIFRNLTIPPLKFSEFSGHDFVAWMTSRKDKNGEWFTDSAYTNYRSALYHLYANYNQEIKEGFKIPVDEFFDMIPKIKYDKATKKRNETVKSSTTKKRRTSTNDIDDESSSSTESDTRIPKRLDETTKYQIHKEIFDDFIQKIRDELSNQEMTPESRNELQIIRKQVKNSWKSKLNDVSPTEFTEIWSKVKKDVEGHLTNNPWKALWYPDYEVNEDDDKLSWFRKEI